MNLTHFGVKTDPFWCTFLDPLLKQGPPHTDTGLPRKYNRFRIFGGFNAKMLIFDVFRPKSMPNTHCFFRKWSKTAIFTTKW